MITLYSKDFSTKYGVISSLCEAFVEEERNGLFELSFIMLNTDSLFNYIKEDNIVVANANDTLLNQKFRIYMTRKLMNNRVEVFARHISFDLMYDYIDNLSFENQSCEYALNQLFRNSNFSTHYRGYSDIVNAQNYNMSMANVLEAIGGKKGSIVDTFGTGAEILRDNENIHVLNKRGYDNEVTIEYKKNLTGFELEEDTTDLVTRILPYAKYNNSETNEEIVLKADYVDSPLIANYSHPYIASIDYSDKFGDGEIPTVSKLQDLARKEYKNNKVDIPKQNYKIEFMPLSKCVGYEDLEDKISLCDTVTVIDTRYNVKTQAKVIKTVFNVLKNRYESIELGEPKTSLGDIVGNGSNESVIGPPGPQGPPGQDGSIGDFPNSLPSTPVVTATVYGFANIEISWTFENKVYYQYEVYASKEVDFIPNTFNLIHQGQTSSFMYQAKPNETWYFKVCCVNSHGERTSFGSAYAITSKVSDLSNYVSEMAIDDALIGNLRLDRGWIGQLNANLLDVKGNFSVTDGNGKRTLDIDSFGNVNLDVNTLKIRSGDVGEKLTQLELNQDNIKIDFASGSKNNILKNGKFKAGINYWNKNNNNDLLETFDDTLCLEIREQDRWGSYDSEIVECEPNTLYTLYTHIASEIVEYTDYSIVKTIVKVVYLNNENNVISTQDLIVRNHQVGWGDNDINNITFTTPNNCTKLKIEYAGSYTNTPYRCVFKIYSKGFCITKGENNGYFPSTDEIYSENILMDTNGITVKHQNGAYSIFNSEGSNFYSSDGNDMTSLRNGGVIGYHAPTNEMIGHIFPTNKTNGHLMMNGWSISNSILGDYISISKANNNEESGFDLEDIIICYTNDVEHLGGLPRGTYFKLLDVNFDTRTFFNNHIHIQNKALMFNSRDYDYKNEIVANENNNNDFEVHGCDSLTLGVRHDYTKYPAITIIKEPSASSRCYGKFECDFDLCGKTIYNGYFNGNLTTSYNIASGYNVDIENDVDILIANEDITNIDEKGNVEYDLNDMVKLLYEKIHELEKEIEILKNSKVD